MNNSQYYKILKEIKAEVSKNGISTDIVKDLKRLRVMVVDEKNPVLAKVLRLMFQNIEKTGTFEVAIPEDEPIEDIEIEVVKTDVEIVPEDSLDYLLSILLEPNNKTNIADIRAFITELKEIAGEDW